MRTGFGGQRILISGGCLALPFLHKVEEINMRTLRIEVRRTAEKSVITEDRMRVDVELEFYVRVIPSQEGIATAAQALGAKSFTVDGIRNLLEGRFVDAVQAVAARHTMDSLHEGRAEFVANISDLLRENLKQNGILLDSVSLTRLDQSAFSSFDENNAFNAVGLRKLAEIIAVNRKKRAEIEADADISVRQTQLEATKQRLILTQQEEQAQINQHLEIEKIRAASDAEAAKAREESMIASEDARIERERQTKAMEVAKQSELRKLELDSQLGVEMKKVDSAIQLAAKHVEEAKSRAQAELARAEVVLAEEHVQTERDRAVADRSHEIAIKRVNEQGAVEQAKAETDAGVLLRRIRAESEAVRTKAEAERLRLLAQSEGERAVIDAENSQSDALIRMKLEQYRSGPVAGDRFADDEAGGKNRFDPHSSDQRIRRRRARNARRQWRCFAESADQPGDGQHSRHGSATSGAEEHRRLDRTRLFLGRRARRTTAVTERKKGRDPDRSEK